MTHKRTQGGKIEDSTVFARQKTLTVLFFFLFFSYLSYFALLTSKQHKKTKGSKISISGVYFYSQIQTQKGVCTAWPLVVGFLVAEE